MPIRSDSTEAPEQGRLTLGTKLAFGSGQVAESVYNALFNTFVTIFYNQVIGLSNTLIGIALLPRL